MSFERGPSMKMIELIGHVDEQHRLSVDVPSSVPPGPVRVVLELPAEERDEDEGSWAGAVGQAWAAEWSDPREDIYTLEDGKPEDEPR
jgi:hypothetical protein